MGEYSTAAVEMGGHNGKAIGFVVGLGRSGQPWAWAWAGAHGPHVTAESGFDCLITCKRKYRRFRVAAVCTDAEICCPLPVARAEVIPALRALTDRVLSRSPEAATYRAAGQSAARRPRPTTERACRSVGSAFFFLGTLLC